MTLRDRLPFLKAGIITRSRAMTRRIGDEPKGDLWVPALHDLWSYLAGNPKLGERLDLHRGIEWLATDRVPRVEFRSLNAASN